jgi:hypothetical protein
MSGLALAVVLAAGSVAGAPAPTPLRPDAGRPAAAPPALQEKLREDPFVYFRFLNTEWAAAVCEAFRVIAAAEQIGRIRHDVLLVAPRREEQGPDVRDWWVRTWDETYVEMAIADLASPDELAEVAHDVGAQLGSTNLRHSIPFLEAQLRRAELAAVRRLGPRIRATARRLVDELLAGWEE